MATMENIQMLLKELTAVPEESLAVTVSALAPTFISLTHCREGDNGHVEAYMLVHLLN